MKTFAIWLLVVLAPFVVVYAAWVLTWFAYDVRTVFTSPSIFWYISTIYWVLCVTIGPAVHDQLTMPKED